MRVDGKIIREGDWITIDGGTGEVFLGEVPTVEPTLQPELETILAWADRYRKLKVRTNADTPHDARLGRNFGAEGIGLCRTEHMFFAPDRILAVRQMILAEGEEERRKALETILPMQRDDFVEIFSVMEGYPVTVRLLDPPLHEFLPKSDKEFEELSRAIHIPVDILKSRANALYEVNPMLGHRGSRLAITYPEIYEMQVRAIFEAAAILIKQGKKVYPEVMVPLIADDREIAWLRERLGKVSRKVCEEYRVEIPFVFGTMIELPRAALIAGKIAEYAEFFSFGTNDLTQMTWGISRDDSGKFLPAYQEKRLLETDPFVTLDREGVGRLMKIAVEEGRKKRQNLKAGICGEHGGDPKSIYFCREVGLNYVSASPFRVITARIASAQAELLQEMEKPKGE
jgi:pyruvate,orthophosphate dikinase